MRGEHFPIGSRRRRLVSTRAAWKQRFVAEDGKGRIQRGHYSWTDSPLDDDSGIQTAFAATFEKLLPQRGKMRTYVESLLKDRRGKAVGIEFGGVGNKLFSGFSPNFFAQTIGVTLIDHREQRRSNGVARHRVLEGDMLDPTTYTALDRLINGQKADFIIERLGRGMEFIPPEPYTLMRTLDAWYDRLNTGGVMFVQVPRRLGLLLRAWVTMLQREYPALETRCFISNDMDTMPGAKTSFFLYRGEGAPRMLPTLDPRTIKRIGILSADHREEYLDVHGAEEDR